MADSRSPKATMSEFLKNIDCFTYVVLAGIGHLTILYFSCFSCFCKIHFLLVDEQAQVTIYSTSSVATLWQSRPLSLRSIVKFYSPLTIMTNTIPGLHRKMRKLSTIVILTCVDGFAELKCSILNQTFRRSWRPTILPRGVLTSLSCQMRLDQKTIDDDIGGV